LYELGNGALTQWQLLLCAARNWAAGRRSVDWGFRALPLRYRAVFRHAYRCDQFFLEYGRLRQKLLGGLLALVAGATATGVAAQESSDLEIGLGPPIQLLRGDHEDLGIDIDGHLDESIWQQIEPIDKMKVTKPDTLADVPYRTDMRVLYTERGLYVSFDMEQPQDTLVERFVARDVFEVSRDRIDFTLDTSGDGRYGYLMGLSLGDSQMDGTILPERQYGITWDGAWYGATQRTLKGWAAEFFIPWSQMAMPKSAATRRVGIRASRFLATRGETWGWPSLTETQPRFISRFQPLDLKGVDPRQTWSVFPYASSTIDRVTEETRFKVGADLFWRPSTNFQLTGTLNPDFGAVESDDVVINLTADETFFPEKRLFFLEGREIFQLSGRRADFRQQPLTVLNTRRIGGRPRDVNLPPGVELSDREELKPADIITAAKATGQIGAFRYGLLAAFEDDTDYTADDNLRYSQDGRDFGAFRILYEDSKGAAYRGIGWITTLVAHPEADALVHGTDFHYLSNTGRWNINGQLLASDRDETGTGTGATTDITFSPRQGLKHEFRMTLLDETIDVNDLGFQTRNDVNDFTYQLEWDRSGFTKIRNFQVSPFLRYAVNGDGYETNSAIAVSGELTFNNLFKLNGFFAFLPQRYDDRNSFGNGTFEIRQRSRGELNFNTDFSRSISFFGKLGYAGEAVYGTSVDTKLGVSWRPKHNLSMQLQAEYSDKDGWLLHQEDQNFTSFQGTQWQPELKLDYFPTSKQQLGLALQWVGVRAFEDRFYTLPVNETELVEGSKPPGATDDFSVSQLNFQVRYRWQIAPLSDLFIVYTKGDKSRPGLTEFDDLYRDSWNNPLGDQLVIKLRYRLGS